MRIGAIYCTLRGHDLIPVSEVRLVPRAGGMLPSLDGRIAYAPDPDGRHRACRRCRLVLREEDADDRGKATAVDP